MYKMAIIFLIIVTVCVVFFLGIRVNSCGIPQKTSFHKNNTKLISGDSVLQINNTYYFNPDNRVSYVMGYPLGIPKRSDSLSVKIRRWKTRKKRGLLQLYSMISCATDCDPLSYKGYGCYCGFLGSGSPIDGIDKCCKVHDICYEKANCPMYLEYFLPYYWTCLNRKPFCANNQAEFHSSGPCANMLCECDRVLSECLKRFPCPTAPAFCTSSSFRLFQNAFMSFT